MTFNLMPIILQDIRNDFENLITTVTDAAGAKGTADQMERYLFRQLLCLGAKLLTLFFEMRSANYPRGAATRDDGVTLPYHSEKTRAYFSIFGEIEISRPYFYQRGQGGDSPLDADLGLGADSYSDCLRELHDELSVFGSFERVVKTMQRFLGIELSTQSVHKFIDTDSEAVETYYDQKAAPPADEEGAILVIQSDGKGVPIIKASATKDKLRLNRGEARSRKKAVNATVVYSIDPAPRTVAAVLATLLRTGEGGSDLNRSAPKHKQIWGTLASKATALARLKQQVDKRDGPHIQQRVMLCDGDKSLQERLLKQFPDFVLILDFIHAYEYLWQVATAFWGSDCPEREAWMQAQTRCLLQGEAGALATAFRAMAPTKGRSALQKKILTKVARYFDNNAAYMDYTAYLAQGWPIASGVIEGVCRHFVKDRMELSGMRWSIQGAENLLRLRAVAENGDWQSYHRFRQQQRQQRLYQRDWPEDITLPTLSRPLKRAQRIPRRETTITAAQMYARLPLAV